MVGCNGRAGMFLCATAMIMGLNVRVGLEDSHWLYPHRDEPCPITESPSRVRSRSPSSSAGGPRPATITAASSASSCATGEGKPAARRDAAQPTRMCRVSNAGPELERRHLSLKEG